MIRLVIITILITGSAVPDDGSTAGGHVLVVVSSSVGPGSVVPAAGGAKFLNSMVPVMLCEASLEDDFRLQSANGTTMAIKRIPISWLPATRWQPVSRWDCER